MAAIERHDDVFVLTLGDDENRERYRDDVNWSLVDDELRGLGGVRIEDTVHVTTSGPEVLSAAIPKQLSIGS